MTSSHVTLLPKFNSLLKMTIFMVSEAVLIWCRSYFMKHEQKTRVAK